MVPDQFYKGISDALKAQKFFVDFDEFARAKKVRPKFVEAMRAEFETIQKMSRAVAFTHSTASGKVSPLFIPIIDADTTDSAFFEDINAQLEPSLLRLHALTVTMPFLGSLNGLLGVGQAYAAIFYVFGDSAKATEYTKQLQNNVRISRYLGSVAAGGWAIDVPSEEIHQNPMVHISTSGAINSKKLKQSLFGHN